MRNTAKRQLVSRFTLSMLGTMPTEVVFLIFVLIVGCLCVLVRWEYRKLIRSREARLFEQLQNSQF
jgi:hypothetical protein